MQMSLNFFRTAYLVDFGASFAALHVRQLQALRTNYTVVSSVLLLTVCHIKQWLAVIRIATIAPMQEHIVQTNLTVAAASASYLKAMLLPQTASFNFTLQVYSPQAFSWQCT